MKGHAKRVGPGVISWKGVSHGILAGNDPHYDNQPWEVEAHILAPQINRKIQSVPQHQLDEIWHSI